MASLLRERFPDKGFRGGRPDPAHLRDLVEGDAAYYKADGSPLLILRRGGVSPVAAELAYPFLHQLRTSVSTNRANYSGVEKRNRVRKDGLISNTLVVPPVSTTVVGYFDRSQRFPFCRETALVSQHPEGWGTLQPLIREVSEIFRAALPQRWAAQDQAARATHPAYVIAGTPYTTLTVNNTVAAGYHKDSGDYHAGFGCLMVLRRGEYTGGELILPAWRVGVDLRDRDVILFDVHEFHGNLPIVGVGPAKEPEKGGHERISVVFYFREKMVECLPPAEEALRARLARGGLDKGPGEVRGLRWTPGEG